MKSSKFFNFYSIPMRDFLAQKGIRYEIVGLHPESKKMFWIYIKDEKLDKAMQEWSKK